MKENAFAMLESRRAWASMYQLLHRGIQRIQPWQKHLPGGHLLQLWDNTGLSIAGSCDFCHKSREIFFSYKYKVGEYVKITASIYKWVSVSPLYLKGEVSDLKCQTAEVNHKSLAFLWWQWHDSGVAWLLIEEHLELSNVCVAFKCPICLKKGEECILMWPEQGSLGWILEYLLQNEHCSHGAFHKDFWRGQLSPGTCPLGSI